MTPPPRGRGRPRIGNRILVRLSDDLIARVDAMRGDVPRAAYLRTLVEIAITTLYRTARKEAP